MPSKPILEPLDAQSNREILRVVLLQTADSANPRAIPSSIFYRRAVREVLDVTKAAVSKEIQYLLDKGLLVDVPQLLSPEIRHYRIHANGRDFLAETGQEE